MTLIVSVVTPERTVLLGDRRITAGGQTVDDSYNKVCVYCCEDARVTLAFTGVAAFEGFDTSSWLLRELHALGEAGIDKLFDALELIRRRLGPALRGVGLADQFLQIVVSGYFYDESGPNPFRCVVTNQADSGCSDEFVIEFLNTNDAASPVHIAGATSAVPSTSIDQLAKLASRKINRASLVRKAVEILQGASAAAPSLGTIGQHCNSVTILSAVNTPILCTYHAPEGTHSAYGPNVVISGGGWFEGPEIMAMTLLAGPSLHKNQRCWCGSGKKFKQCHLKKFGSVYVNLPGFTAPMSWLVNVGFDKPRLSGSEFSVSGHFE
jgi:hypothetical protein